MTATLAMQEAIVTTVESDEAFVVVQDLDLMYVGGGSDTGGLF